MNQLNKIIMTTALLAYGASLSAETLVTESKQVNTNEYQFGEAHQSPSRTVLLDKFTSVDASTTQKSWDDKNKTLQALTPKSITRYEQQTLSNNDFWFYDSWVTVKHDIDFDGYFSTVEVEFDADTVYNRAYVYGIVYLGVGDVFDSIHVTSVFAIDGDASTDSFTIESDLLSGFPSDDYEIMIELYDADTDGLVAITDGFDDADLAFVPLESQNYDVAQSRVVVVEEHGGSVSIGVLLLMLAAGLRALRIRETH